MRPHLQRAQHLLSVRRPEDAARTLLEHLAQDPDDADALALLAFASIAMQRFDEAVEHARRAVQAAPEEAFPYLAVAEAELRRNRTKPAEEAARRAVAIDPDAPDGFGLLGAVLITRKRWAEALEVADRGLACDPEHDTCSNVRAMALRNLGRGDEATRALDGQLQHDPDDPRTHANQGWNLLHAGDHQRARAHFREALRLDPTLDWARHGLREALKARHWLYRPVLRYFLWMQSLSGRVQTAVLIGGWFGYRAVARLAAEDSALQPVFFALVAAYVLFVVTSWFATPIADGLLALHPDGRATLTRRERTEAWAICGLLLAGGAALGIGAFATGPLAALLTPGFVVLLLCLPLSQAFALQTTRARRAMLAFTGLCALLGSFVIFDTLSAAPERAALKPWIEDGQRIAEEHDEVRERWNALTPAERTSPRGDALRARVEEVAAESAAFDQAARDQDIIERARAVGERKSRTGTLNITLAILCFWVSQMFAAWVAKRHER